MRVLQHQTDMPEKSQNFFGDATLKLNYYKSNTGWSKSVAEPGHRRYYLNSGNWSTSLLTRMATSLEIPRNSNGGLSKMKLMLGCNCVIGSGHCLRSDISGGLQQRDGRIRARVRGGRATLAEAVKLAKTAVEISRRFLKLPQSMISAENIKRLSISRKVLCRRGVDGRTKLFAANYAHPELQESHEISRNGRVVTNWMELNDPGSFWYNYGVASKGKALRRQNKPAEALELLTEDAVFIMHPQHQDKAILERAHSRRAVRQFSEAADDYIRSFELAGGAPWRKDIAVGYAIECLTESDRMDEAAPWVARIDNVGSKFWRCFAHMRAAQLLQKQGKLAEAKAQYEAAIKDNDYWWKNSSEQQISAIDEQLSE